MQSITAVVLGATGFIGELLVQQLLNDASFSKVRILVRRPVKLSHPKLEVEVTNFNDLTNYRQKLGKGDCIFCCIGTTQKQVKGDKALYTKIDVDIPVNAAKMGLDAGFNKYLIVSSVGANANSSNFYLRLKGTVEKEIAALNYKSYHVFRPGILLGQRKEFRFAEVVGKGFMQSISVLLTGDLKKYRGIQGEDLAKAMVAAAKMESGTFVHHYESMMELAGK